MIPIERSMSRMVIKTRTAILILVAAFIVFFSLAAWLVNRLVAQMRQGSHDNSTYVSEPMVPAP